jgi:hypothetical protein
MKELKEELKSHYEQKTRLAELKAKHNYHNEKIRTMHYKLYEKKTYTSEEWQAEGKRRFGNDQMKWEFVCPACGHVASVADWKRVGASVGEVAFSCVGRHIDGSKKAFENGIGPCDYTGGGLFRINPIRVEKLDGESIDFFDFAEE